MSTPSSAQRPDRPVDPREARNEDPITNEAGAHPVGTGIGAAAAGIAGGFVGSAVGPIGTVAGSALGAVAGGYLGHAVAEVFDPTEEDAYWRREYRTRSYVVADDHYDDLRPAYKLGWEGYSTHARAGKKFDDVEGDLRQQWETVKGKSTCAWDRAKSAAKDAWDRIATTSSAPR